MAKLAVILLPVLCSIVHCDYLSYLNSHMQSLLQSVTPFGYQIPSSASVAFTQSPDLSRSPVNGFGFSNPLPGLYSEVNPALRKCGLPPAFCPKSRYRSIDGSCNNLQNPKWGMSQTPYSRLVPYNYGDGISALPISQTGSLLPNPREISLRLFPDKQLIDPVWNLNAQQWGQIITHDMSMTAGVAQSHKDITTCCDESGQLTPGSTINPSCAPILIPPNDLIHASQGAQCMNFVRTTTTRDRGCTPPSQPAEPLSVVTAYMDLSLVYGSSAEKAAALRAFVGGRLATLVRRGREWPPQDTNITQTCESAASINEPCYMTGDVRTNQNTQLTILQIILLREHNRIADTLAKYNPYWDDETIYQEARRIHIAEIQHINYYEYLPIFLGFQNMVKNKLIYPGAKGYVNDYNPSVNPSVLDEHANAAFRHFHTLIRGYLQMYSENRNLTGFVRMSDWFNRPLLLEIHNVFDDLTRGLTVQPQDYSDQFWDTEITQFLFKRNRTYGSDLRAVDIQRGRSHGLGSYVSTRAACNLPVPNSFDDMLDFISKKNVRMLQTLYQTPNDVELVVAGSLERNVPGAQAGPTFLCILTEQFYRTRTGDRYFYENGQDREIAFTPSQLESIRRGSSMARLLCDNADNIYLMQPKAFEQVSFRNKLVLCNELPAVDLSLWADSTSYYKK